MTISRRRRDSSPAAVSITPAAAGERNETVDVKTLLIPFALSTLSFPTISGSADSAAGPCSPLHAERTERRRRKSPVPSYPALIERRSMRAIRAEMESEAIIRRLRLFLSASDPEKSIRRNCGTKPSTDETKRSIPEEYLIVSVQMIPNCSADDPRSESIWGTRKRRYLPTVDCAPAVYHADCRKVPDLQTEKSLRPKLRIGDGLSFRYA